MKQKLKRLLSCFLSLLMIAGSLLGSPEVWAETVQLPDGSTGELITAEDVFGRHQVHSQSGYKHFLTYDGVPKADDFAYWEYNGKRYPAYCISPTKPGATELGSYDVNVKELTPNPKLYWILRITPQQILVSATMMKRMQPPNLHFGRLSMAGI